MQDYMSTVVKTNIANHLFITIHCPKCNQMMELSLGMIHSRKEGFCPNCITPMSFYTEGEKLDSFVAAFDSLYEQLDKYELYLTLSLNPDAIMLESE